MADKNTTLTTNDSNVALDALYHGSSMKQDIKEGEILTIDRGMVAEANPNKAENETVIAVRNDEGEPAVLNRITLEPGGGLEVKKVDKTADPTSKVKRLVTVEYLTPEERAEKLKEAAPVRIPKKQTLDFKSSDPDTTGKPLGSAVSESSVQQADGGQSQSPSTGAKIGDRAFEGQQVTSQAQTASDRQMPQPKKDTSATETKQVSPSRSAQPVSKNTYEQLKELRKESPLEAEQIFKESLQVPQERRQQYIQQKVQDSHKRKSVAKSSSGRPGVADVPIGPPVPAHIKLEDPMGGALPETPVFAPQSAKPASGVDGVDDLIASEQQKAAGAKPVASGAFAMDDAAAQEQSQSSSAPITGESYLALKELEKTSPDEAEHILIEALNMPADQRDQFIMGAIEAHHSKVETAYTDSGDAPDLDTPSFAPQQEEAVSGTDGIDDLIPSESSLTPENQQESSEWDKFASENPEVAADWHQLLLKDPAAANEISKLANDMPLEQRGEFIKNELSKHDLSTETSDSVQNVDSTTPDGDPTDENISVENTGLDESSTTFEINDDDKNGADTSIDVDLDSTAGDGTDLSLEVEQNNSDETAVNVDVDADGTPDAVIKQDDGSDSVSIEALNDGKIEIDSDGDGNSELHLDEGESVQIEMHSDGDVELSYDTDGDGQIDTVEQVEIDDVGIDLNSESGEGIDVSINNDQSETSLELDVDSDGVTDVEIQPEADSTLDEDVNINVTTDAVVDVDSDSFDDMSVDSDDSDTTFEINDDNTNESDTSLDIDLDSTAGDDTDLSLEIKQDNSDETTVNVDLDADGTPDAAIEQDDGSDNVSIEALNDGNIEIDSDGDGNTDVQLDEGDSVEIDMQSDGDVELSYDTDGDGQIDTVEEAQPENIEIELNSNSGESVEIGVDNNQNDAALEIDVDNDGSHDVEIQAEADSTSDEDVNINVVSDAVVGVSDDNSDANVSVDTDTDNSSGNSENPQMSRAKPEVLLDRVKGVSANTDTKGRMKRGKNTTAPIMPTPILSSDKSKKKSKMPSFFKPPKLAGKRH